MSEALSRSVGTSIGKTFSLNSRSALNSFFSVIRARSLCVAQTVRTSTFISLLEPIL